MVLEDDANRGETSESKEIHGLTLIRTPQLQCCIIIY
jgi:hypothetical protein